MLYCACKILLYALLFRRNDRYGDRWHLFVRRQKHSSRLPQLLVHSSLPRRLIPLAVLLLAITGAMLMTIDVSINDQRPRLAISLLLYQHSHARMESTR